MSQVCQNLSQSFMPLYWYDMLPVDLLSQRRDQPHTKSASSEGVEIS